MMTAARLRWELERAARALGLPGWVALALLAACGFVGWGLALPERGDAERLERTNIALARRLATKSTAPVDAGPQAQLDQFRRRFIDEKQLAPAVSGLQAIARRQGIRLDQAEFKFASEAGEPLSRYAIVLPFKADYRALRRFTREALREFPGLAIEELNLRRADPKLAVLDVQLKLVLFVGKAD